MKYIFWGIVILVVLGVVVVGGGAYWLANIDVDFKDPQMVGKFSETYGKNCVATYQKQLTKAGTPPTPEQLVAAEAACKCARDPVIAALAKRPTMTVSELAGTMATDPEILAITKTCSEAAGLSAPQ
ncbi:hypothetical protein [Dongia sp. agr-C8]